MARYNPGQKTKPPQPQPTILQQQAKKDAKQKSNLNSNHNNFFKSSRKNSDNNSSSSLFIEMAFGTINIIFGIIFISVGLIINFLRKNIQTLIGNQFTFDSTGILWLAIPILIFGILLQIYSIQRAREKNYIVYGQINFFLGIFMTGMIIFMISKYSLNWFGLSLFGNTEIGKNTVFYMPSLLYLVYSMFIIYYSYHLKKK